MKDTGHEGTGLVHECPSCSEGKCPGLTQKSSLISSLVSWHILNPYLGQSAKGALGKAARTHSFPLQGPSSTLPKTPGPALPKARFSRPSDACLLSQRQLGREREDNRPL